MRFIFVLVAVAAAAFLVKGQTEPENDFDDSMNRESDLPAGAEGVIGQLIPGFSCAKRGYGYYADVANACKVFHVCWPITDAQGTTLSKQWTFICGNETLFNQERLICDSPDRVDCSKSESFYKVNDEFGHETTPH